MVGTGGGGMEGMGGGKGDNGGMDADEIKLDCLRDDDRARPLRSFPAEKVCLYARAELFAPLPGAIC